MVSPYRKKPYVQYISIMGHNFSTRYRNPLLRLAIDSPGHVDVESTLIHGEQSNIHKDMDH